MSSSFATVTCQRTDVEWSRAMVLIDNGILQVTLSKPEGFIVGIAYNGIDNVLDARRKEDARGYWDVVWSKPGIGRNKFDKLPTTDYKVIVSNEEQVEVSFSMKWSPALGDSAVPLNIDKRYIVRRGKSGVYAYAIMERLKGWPDVNMDQIRMAFKLHVDMFDYMVVSDDLHRHMPTVHEHDSGRVLAYPEATVLSDTRNPEHEGEVDDKYAYAMELKDSKVHGFVSSHNPQVGFWLIRPSDEACTGGPMRQELTSHAGPIVLSMFTSTHYSGMDMDTEYRNGEPWKKVFGPNFIYLNSVPSNDEYIPFWHDAKQQAEIEALHWPYDFVESQDFPNASMRGIVSGQLALQNEGNSTLGRNAYVGLGNPGELGSWQFDSKGYQFWTQADFNGNFLIQNVREGEYNLYAWVPGFIGDYKFEGIISIKPGSQIKLGVITYRPPRNGPTLWEIGIPDRSAGEFFVPHPIPAYENSLYVDKPIERFRQYGLWERYVDLYPTRDLVYNVGTSNWSRDWFFAHVTRQTKNGYEPTTWEIVFEIGQVQTYGNYTFQLALAGASSASLEVRVNDDDIRRKLVFRTENIGKDNAIARHGIHGLYWLFSIGIPSNMLVRGHNVIYLTQAKATSPFQGLMYDYLRLEAPPLR
ncbi:probable rhamnogalacturonate lyase B [Euphorbia lathyris]|uniref:probable rhamnogalacturonate lyase B n=1 Tax=Euphorbia lathyris TaxID=212925 RepID=UPI003313E20A